MIAGESPGSIRNQVGRSLNAIREQIEQEDVPGLLNHFSLLVALSAPVMTPDERGSVHVPELPDARDRDGRAASKAFKSCMDNLAQLLCILAEHKLYAWKEAEMGDASALALGNDEEDAEPAVPA